MKLRTVCTQCKAEFRVKNELRGKRAKCPKCNESFVIAFDTDEDMDIAGACSQESAAEQRVPSDSDTVDSESKSSKSSSYASALKRVDDLRSSNQSAGEAAGSNNGLIMLIGAVVVSLVAGYFVGREHVKYEMKSRSSDRFDEIREHFGPRGRSAPPSFSPRGRSAPSKGNRE